MPVEFERLGKVGVLRLRRPDCANALDRRSLQRLWTLQESIRKDPRIHVLVTMGHGRGFCAGSDLKELSRLTPDEMMASQLLESRVCRNFLSLPQPTIAAIHGYAIGAGLFLAAHHDIRVAAASSRLALPEVKLGWNPTFGMQRLSQVAGRTAATNWLVSGEEFTASSPQAQMFLTRVVAEDSEALETSLEIAKRLASLPARGLAAIKHALWHQTRHALEEADSLEARLFRDCLTSAPARASLRKFRKSE